MSCVRGETSLLQSKMQARVSAALLTVLDMPELLTRTGAVCVCFDTCVVCVFFDTCAVCVCFDTCAVCVCFDASILHVCYQQVLCVYVD